MPRLAPVLLTALICACTARDSTPTATDPDPPRAVVESETTTEPVSQPEGPEYFFALASKRGVEHCPNGVDIEWLDVESTLGWTPSSGPALAELEPLLGQAVLARGYAGPAPERPPLTIEPVPCHAMQMRSDWVHTPVGLRVRRTASAGVAHFFVTHVRRLDELSATLDGDEILTSFRNPLPFALTGVRLRMHYEGCYGKPGTRMLESEPVTLAPGEALEHRFAIFVDEGQAGRNNHRAAALALEIAGSEGPPDAVVRVDLDVSLGRFGIDFDC
jgi:hypothetical protein